MIQWLKSLFNKEKEGTYIKFKKSKNRNGYFVNFIKRNTNLDHRISVDIDSFDETKKISYSGIGDWGSGKVICFSSEPDTITYVGPKVIDDTFYMSFSTYQKEIKIKIGDQVILLLGNGQKIPLAFSENGKRVDKDSDGVIVEGNIKVEKSVYNEITSGGGVIKWRYISVVTGENITPTLDAGYTHKLNEMLNGITYVYDNFKELISE
jgi:hypothetical protein